MESIVPNLPKIENGTELQKKFYTFYFNQNLFLNEGPTPAHGSPSALNLFPNFLYYLPVSTIFVA